MTTTAAAPDIKDSLSLTVLAMIATLVDEGVHPTADQIAERLNLSITVAAIILCELRDAGQFDPRACRLEIYNSHYKGRTAMDRSAIKEAIAAVKAESLARKRGTRGPDTSEVRKAPRVHHQNRFSIGGKRLVNPKRRDS